MILQDKTEWRTIALLIVCYGSVGLMIFNPLALPLWAQVLILVPLITLHSSLQHEYMHGHPFKAQLLNDILVWLPVGIFLPYFRFKAAHLKHHMDCQICDPFEDPESWYKDPADWDSKPQWVKMIFDVTNTLLGRMVLGPAFSVVGFTFHEMGTLNTKNAITWALHFAAAFGLLAALHRFSELPVWVYLLCCYGGYSLLMVRTFLEHRAHEVEAARTVAVEDKGILSYLFLNNNLHVVHHMHPKLAWYQLPQLFEEKREHFLAVNNGYYYKNYLEIFRRFAFKRKEPVRYPLDVSKSAHAVRAQ